MLRASCCTQSKTKSAVLFARASTFVWYLPFEDRPTNKHNRVFARDRLRNATSTLRALFYNLTTENTNVITR